MVSVLYRGNSYVTLGGCQGLRPGKSYMSREDAEAVLAHPYAKTLVAAGLLQCPDLVEPVPVVAETVLLCEMKARDAIDVVQASDDRTTLDYWGEVEERVTVRRAIIKRLTELAVS